MSVDGNEKRIRKISIQNYYLYELAVIYKCSKYDMRNMLEPFKKQIGKRKGLRYRSKQVALIFSLVELPSDVEIVRA